MSQKPSFSFSQIISMNLGFLGIQYSFGLQQTAINPLYSMLGANPDELPLLNLAGPITGLIIQPLIGAMSDRTWSPKWGRRKPFFLIGAIFCSLCLFLFPFSSSLWMAAGLLWILDAANNTAMEPYRAVIADQLNEEQQPTGFLAQSFFTGLGTTLANLSLFILPLFISVKGANGIPYWVYGSFFIGAVVSIGSILYSMKFITETPPSREEQIELNEKKFKPVNALSDIYEAILNMPKVLWQLALVYLFQWYALFIYWQFICLSLAKSLWNSDSTNKPLFEQAVSWTGLVNGWYNIVTFCVAFYLVKLAHKFGAKKVHAICLLFAAIGLFILPMVHTKEITLIPIIGLGIAWASIMGVPYIFAVPAIPPTKYGVYMGIINMMIVVPMFIQTVTFKYIYNGILSSNPNNAITFAAGLFLIASVATLFIQTEKRTSH